MTDETTRTKERLELLGIIASLEATLARERESDAIANEQWNIWMGRARKAEAELAALKARHEEELDWLMDTLDFNLQQSGFAAKELARWRTARKES